MVTTWFSRYDLDGSKGSPAPRRAVHKRNSTLFVTLGTKNPILRIVYGLRRYLGVTALSLSSKPVLSRTGHQRVAGINGKREAGPLRVVVKGHSND